MSVLLVSVRAQSAIHICSIVSHCPLHTVFSVLALASLGDREEKGRKSKEPEML